MRVLTKGARRLREQKSRVSLLETKLDRVARESDLLQLHQTIDEKEEGLQRAQEEVHAYKSKHWRSEVRHSRLIPHSPSVSFPRVPTVKLCC